MADVLPPPLKAAVEAVGRDLAKGWVDRAAVAELLPDLAALPPARVATVNREILIAARLWDESLRLGFIGHPTHKAILADVPGLEWLFLFHSDGRVREAALMKIGGPLVTPFQVASVIYRLNDWVSQVRQAAGRCAGRIVAVTPAIVLAEAGLHLTGSTAEWGRWGDAEEVFFAMIGRPDVATELIRALAEGGYGGEVRLFRQALRRDTLDAYLPELAATARQPSVRALALQCLVERRARWVTGWDYVRVDFLFGRKRRRPALAERPIKTDLDPMPLIEAGARDPSAPVRRVAADALITLRDQLTGEEPALALLEADPRETIRERIAFVRQKLAERSAG